MGDVHGGPDPGLEVDADALALPVAIARGLGTTGAAGLYRLANCAGLFGFGGLFEPVGLGAGGCRRLGTGVAKGPGLVSCEAAGHDVDMAPGPARVNHPVAQAPG